MKEEILLERKFGKKRPFNVPQGYFYQFEKSIMAKLPEHSNRRTLMKRMLKPVACVACIIVLVISGFTYFHVAEKEVQHANNAIENMPSFISGYYTVDEVSDYAMLDNDDFYSYTSEE